MKLLDDILEDLTEDLKDTLIKSYIEDIYKLKEKIERYDNLQKELKELKENLEKSIIDLKWVNNFNGDYPPIVYMDEGKIELIELLLDKLKWIKEN